MYTKHLAGCLKCSKHSIMAGFTPLDFYFNIIGLLWKLTSSLWWNYSLLTFLSSETDLSPNFLPCHCHLHCLGIKTKFQEANVKSPQALEPPEHSIPFLSNFLQCHILLLVLRFFLISDFNALCWAPAHLLIHSPGRIRDNWPLSWTLWWELKILHPLSSLLHTKESWLVCPSLLSFCCSITLVSKLFRM